MKYSNANSIKGFWNIKYEISILKIESVIPKLLLLITSIIFSIDIAETITLTIADITSANDLFNNLGISFFSFSKNGFNPFFIPLFVKYIIKYSTTKFIPIIAYLYVKFV